MGPGGSRSLESELSDQSGACAPPLGHPFPLQPHWSTTTHYTLRLKATLVPSPDTLSTSCHLARPCSGPLSPANHRSLSLSPGAHRPQLPLTVPWFPRHFMGVLVSVEIRRKPQRKGKEPQINLVAALN